MTFSWSDAVRVAGPGLFGAAAGALYGWATLMMERPLRHGTTGWTDAGSKVALPERVASQGALGAALLNMADEDAVDTARLRSVIAMLEQLLILQARVEARAAMVDAYGDEGAAQLGRSLVGGVDEADVVTAARRARDLIMDRLTAGMTEKNVPLSAEGVPLAPMLRYSFHVISEHIHDVVFNVSVAARKWRGM
jgi:hypothetical protein